MRGGLSPTLSKGEGAISQLFGAPISALFLCLVGIFSFFVCLYY